MSLRKLFKEYLDESDSFEGVELQSRGNSDPAPAAVPAEVVRTGPPETVEVEIEEEPLKLGFVQPWFSLELAHKSLGPQKINITYMELFYDLIFGAVLASFAFNIAFGWPDGKWLNFVQMLMLLALWQDNVIFHSTVFSQDGLSQFLVFLQMIGVLGMSFFRNVAVNGGGDTLIGFVVTYIWARFFQIVLYLCLAFSSKVEKSTKVCAIIYAVLLALTCIPAAASTGIGNTVDTYGRVMIWIVGTGLDHVLLFVLPLIPFWRNALPIADKSHFRDRFGGFMVVIFGYLIYAIFFDAGPTYTSMEWGSVALIFLIAFCFMWMYYGDRYDDEREGNTAPLENEQAFIGQLWKIMHVPLAMALVILADASKQIITFYRSTAADGIVVLPIGQGLRLSNTVQWIYGVAFAIALTMLGAIGLLYKYHTRRYSKRKIERTIGRAILVLVMVLVPLGGLNSAMEPIIQLIVGGVVLFALVVFDMAANVALGPPASSVEKRTVSVPTVSQQFQQSAANLDDKDVQIAELKRQLADARAAADRGAVAGAAGGAAGGGDEETEMSSSKDWGFSSRTSSVVEDVVVSEDAEDSQFSDDPSQPQQSSSGREEQYTPTQSGSEQPNAEDPGEEPLSSDDDE